MYNNAKPLHALIVKCENGYGIDLAIDVEGETAQRTYIATNMDQVLDYISKFFSESEGLI